MKQSLSTINTVIFDIDGTLIDTAPDLTEALNTLLITHGHQPLPFSVMRPHAANGSQGLIKLGFNIDDKASEYPSLRKAFLEIYEKCCLKQSQLFPDMALVLSSLQEQAVNLAVVTNKPSQFTTPILNHLNLNHHFKSVICFDQVKKAKPEPEGLLATCQHIGVQASQCVYIGDTEIDVIAAKRAGMAALIVSYGYQHENENIYSWNADAIIDEPQQILSWVSKQNQVY